MFWNLTENSINHFRNLLLLSWYVYQDATNRTINLSKVELIWRPALNQEFTGFPAKIWIFKLFFLMVFGIKMLLDNAYGLLNLLEFKCNYFNSLFQAESEFKNSNFGRKSSELLIQCRFPNKFNFRHTYSTVYTYQYCKKGAVESCTTLLNAMLFCWIR